MRSNLNELFKVHIEAYRDKVFKIEDLVNEIEKDFQFVTGGTYEDLRREHIKVHVRSLLNANDFYKLEQKGEYISLDNAGLDNLFQIEGNLTNGLKGMTKSIEKVREYERNIMEGQLRFVFCGNAVVGTEEEHSIETVLRREA